MYATSDKAAQLDVALTASAMAFAQHSLLSYVYMQGTVTPCIVTLPTNRINVKLLVDNCITKLLKDKHTCRLLAQSKMPCLSARPAIKRLRSACMAWASLICQSACIMTMVLADCLQVCKHTHTAFETVSKVQWGSHIALMQSRIHQHT